MKTPHKHAELIKAWADGAKIEFLSHGSAHWVETSEPQWYGDYQYRIKPESRPDVVEEISVYRNLYRRFDFERPRGEPFETSWLCNMRITRDGNTSEIKSAEVIK